MEETQAKRLNKKPKEPKVKKVMWRKKMDEFNKKNALIRTQKWRMKIKFKNK